MSIRRFEISMSLDGYVTAEQPNPTRPPMGDGGRSCYQVINDS